MTQDKDRAGEAVQICPHCMAENAEGVHLCAGCGRPMSSHASIDPVMSIASRADTFGKAANSPQKLGVVVGMWLILGPTFLICSFWLVGWVAAFLRGDSDLISMLLALPVMGVFLFISGALLWKVTANFVGAKGKETVVAEDREEEAEWETERGGDKSD